MLIFNRPPVISGLTPQDSLIESIERYTITIPTGATSQTASITTVDDTRTRLWFSGFSCSGDVKADKFFPRWELTDASTITVFRNTSDATHTVTVELTVVQYTSGVITKMRRNTISMANTVASATQAITSVSTTMFDITWCGQTTDYTTDNSWNSVQSRMAQDSATQLSVSRFGSSGAVVVGYEGSEWSSTYVSRVLSNAGTNVGANQTRNDVQMGTGAGTSNDDFFDHQIFVTSRGDRPGNDTTYDKDFRAVTYANARGYGFERQTVSTNGTSTHGLNIIFFKPPWAKKKFITDQGGVTNGNSTGSLVMPANVNPEKAFTVWLGWLAKSAYTKTTASAADVYVRGKYDAANTINLTRGGTTNDANVGLGFYEAA